MAITASGLFVKTWRDIIGTAQLAVNVSSDTINCALFPAGTLTPNLTAGGDTGYGTSPWIAGNEIAGTGGYTQGGKALTTKSLTESPTGTLKFTADNVTWSSSTIANASAALVYDNTLAGKNGLVLVYFGSAYSTTNGTFTIQWNSAGIFTWRLNG